jgi:hypothetical protein
MGMLIGTPNDLETIAYLNAAFSKAQLIYLRGIQGTEQSGALFDGFHTLARLALRLGAYPGPSIDVANPAFHTNVQKNWFGLLTLLNGQAVGQSIMISLASALATGSITKVIFSVIDIPKGSPFSAMRVDNTDPDSNLTIRAITLGCPGTVWPPALAPPVPDPGEGPTVPLNASRP